MATKKELLKLLEPFDDDAIVICSDSQGGWDNITNVEQCGSQVVIKFGGGSPFRDNNRKLIDNTPTREV
jgi:hypothetical protein